MSRSWDNHHRQVLTHHRPAHAAWHRLGMGEGGEGQTPAVYGKETVRRHRESPSRRWLPSESHRCRCNMWRELHAALNLAGVEMGIMYVLNTAATSTSSWTISPTFLSYIHTAGHIPPHTRRMRDRPSSTNGSHKACLPPRAQRDTGCTVVAQGIWPGTQWIAKMRSECCPS